MGVPFENTEVEREVPNNMGRDIPAAELKLDKHSDQFDNEYMQNPVVPDFLFDDRKLDRMLETQDFRAREALEEIKHSDA